MGAAYYKEVTQWSQGDYKNASNSQDDLQELSDRLGYRPDDHGDNNGSASALTDLGGGELSGSGVIERSGEVDVFSFVTDGGNVSITATTYRAESSWQSWGGNLDIELKLYDSSGSLVASSNPESDTNADITETLSAGTYYVHICPVGVGDPLDDDPVGYVQYGSLGQYSIMGLLPGDADSDGIPDEWETTYFSSTAEADPAADSDGDGTDNLTEYIAGTDPTQTGSTFEVTTNEVPQSGTGMILPWDSVPGRIYSVSWCDDLASGFSVIQDNLVHPQNSYTDTVQRAEFGNYYQINVRLE